MIKKQTDPISKALLKCKRFKKPCPLPFRNYNIESIIGNENIMCCDCVYRYKGSSVLGEPEHYRLGYCEKYPFDEKKSFDRIKPLVSCGQNQTECEFYEKEK